MKAAELDENAKNFILAENENDVTAEEQRKKKIPRCKYYPFCKPE